MSKSLNRRKTQESGNQERRCQEPGRPGTGSPTGSLGGRDGEEGGQDSISEISEKVPGRLRLHLSRTCPVTTQASRRRDISDCLVKYLKPAEREQLSRRRNKTGTYRRVRISRHTTPLSLSRCWEATDTVFRRVLWGRKTPDANSMTDRSSNGGEQRHFWVSRHRRHRATQSFHNVPQRPLPKPSKSEKEHRTHGDRGGQRGVDG